ncbi:MAG: hypothetical protein AAFX76_00420 [Planctomycetota bacterium]
MGSRFRASRFVFPVRSDIIFFRFVRRHRYSAGVLFIGILVLFIGVFWLPSRKVKVAVAQPAQVTSTDRDTRTLRPAGVSPRQASASLKVRQRRAAQRASVSPQALDRRPERVSSFLAARPFNRRDYERDPESYLSVVEPMRVHDVAGPGPDIKPIRAVGGTAVTVSPGESVVLRVRVDRGAPVTFTAFDGGLFENDLSTVTVEASGSGQATAEFTATRGVFGSATVVAGSPVCSGQVEFAIVIDVDTDPPGDRG